MLPMPPRASGFNTAQPEEVELWRLQQGLSREREYQQQHRRKTGVSACLACVARTDIEVKDAHAHLDGLHQQCAGTAGTIRVLHAKLASDLATLPILNPTNPTQVLKLCSCFPISCRANHSDFKGADMLIAPLSRRRCLRLHSGTRHAGSGGP